mgnify:FL=1
MKSFLILCVLAVLSGCGGSTNVLPAFTTTVSLASSGTFISERSTSTITLTATLSQVADEAVTVSFSTSGAATEGTDYASLSSITIAAGSVTGTNNFTPTDDSIYEGDEVATVAISSVSGGGASKSGSQSVSITITEDTEHPLNTGTQLTYNASAAAALSRTNEFRYINAPGAASSQNPLEVINAHKAYGYGLTGSGTQIAILDSGFWASHNEMDGKTITTYGAIEAATGVSIGQDHGLFVSSVAAGEDDGSGMQGVAPLASLHISDYTQLNGNTYFPTHWASATNDASSAVVQNNSWGVNYQVDTLKSDIVTNGWTNGYGIAQKWNASGFTANEASTTSYITALNNFQNHGVIVYALSNISSFTDADFQAALPEFFPQLNEAWITAVNIEITGSSGSEVYTRKSAPCGSTAQYCLGADGWELNGAAYNASGGNYYWQGGSGTSFVAPQISGAVALLAEAFPNHTPEQLTDRLLASADNSFFSHTDAVTFGNDVEHGYNAEFGHGVMDIYAALNPITTSGYTRVFTGDSNQNSLSFPLGSSRIISSRSLGDSLIQGLTGEVGYAYDSLNGGFSYDMTTAIDMYSYDMPKINISSELSKLDAPSNPPNSSWKGNFNQVLSKLTKTEALEARLTLGSSSLPVQSFFGSNFDLSNNLNDYGTPYLEADEGGLGLGVTYQLEESRLIIGITSPISQGDGNTIGSRNSFVVSLENGTPSATATTVMAGLTQGKDNLLGSTGIDAYSLTGAKSGTTFAAFKVQTQLGEDLSLTGIATVANTNMTSPSNSFINSASNVKSTSARLGVSKRNVFGDDSVSFFVSQPNRVSKGSMSVRLSNLADNDGNLTYRKKDINLDPSARQLDFALTYRKDFDKNSNFIVKHMVTENFNHSQNSKMINSSFLGARYKHFKIGLSKGFEDNHKSAEMSYAYKF